MSKEKVVLTAINFRRVFENNPPFTVFKAKKNESHPHSSFLGGFRSKVIFQVTRKYLALRGCDRQSHLPMVNRFAVARVQPMLWLYPISITLKHKCYGR